MNRVCMCAAAALLLSTCAAADEVLIAAAKDNTLFNDPNGLVSNGAGPHFFVGKSGFNTPHPIRRGLIAFDVAGNVPPGATIECAELTLHVSMISKFAVPASLTVHRLFADWGEGASHALGGMGVPSQPDDATWIHTFFDTDFWQSAGGDFAETSSTEVFVDVIGFYTWPSTAVVVGDVQSWLDQPEANFGWEIIGDESVNFTAKRFDTREHLDPTLRPVLTVTFTPGPECDPCDMDCDGEVNAFDIEPFLDLLFGPDEPCDTCTGDVDGNGIIDAFDIEPFLECLFP